MHDRPILVVITVLVRLSIAGAQEETCSDASVFLQESIPQLQGVHRLSPPSPLSEQRNCLRAIPPNMEELILRNADQVTAWKMAAEEHAAGFVPVTGTGKIAFLFLIGGDFPHEHLWASWLEAAPADKFKVLVHSYTGTFTPVERAFMNKTIPVIDGSWCNVDPIMLGLNRKALEDSSVSKTVLMCESTVPIKPFHVVYEELMHSEKGSQMCVDIEWGNRGMPFSYVWNRFDAELFTKHEKELRAMFTPDIQAFCKPEELFVVPLKLIQRSFSTRCVTWAGWYENKGFRTSTNGKHYDIITQDPSSVFEPSTCSHPLVIQNLSQATMDGLVSDASFSFARKFKKDTTIGSRPIDVYLRSKLGLSDTHSNPSMLGTMVQSLSAYVSPKEHHTLTEHMNAMQLNAEPSTDKKEAASDACQNQHVDPSEGEPRSVHDNEELVLVTGGAGFIGSTLVNMLLGLGYRVRVLDNLSTGDIQYLDLSHDRLEFVFGDILDLPKVQKAMVGVQGVFHLGAASKVAPSLKNPHMATYNVQQNAIGTAHVLEAANATGHVRKVVYAASSTYYGNQQVPFKETDPFMATSPYSASKYMGELQMLTYDTLYNMPTINLRFFMVYGPRNPKDGAYAIVTGIFMKNKIAGQPLIIEGTGEQFRDFIHVKDIARGLILAYQSDLRGMTINLGSGQKTTIQHLANMVSSNQIHKAPRKNDLKGTLCDTCKAKRLLKFETREDLGQTMQQLISEEQAGRGNFIEPFWLNSSILRALSEQHSIFSLMNITERNVQIRQKLIDNNAFLADKLGIPKYKAVANN